MRYIPLIITGAALATAQSPSVEEAASSTTASTTPSETPTIDPNAPPCFQIGAMQAADPESIYPYDLAYKCLMSVPVEQEGGSELIDQIKLYLAWHTGFNYYKNPPEGSDFEEVDILGALDAIQQNLTSGGYANEFLLHEDIGNLLVRGRDNHLAWSADISNVFVFQRQISLASISEDGLQLPKIYVYEDLFTALENPSFSPSAVAQINGLDALDYLNQIADQEISLHDEDAMHNALFVNPAIASLGQGILDRFTRGSYIGTFTNLTFENGTETSSPNYAITQQNFTGVEDGESFFLKFCSGPPPSTSDETDTPIPPPNDTAPGYPYPVVLHSEYLVGGYFLNGTDVAVLSIPSFLAESSNSSLEFQNVVSEFLMKSTEADKTNLLLDLRGNGGGTTVLGFDLFKQLFPSIEPWGAARLGAHEAFYDIGKLVEPYFINETYAATDPDGYQALLSNFRIFNYVDTALTVDGTDWANFDDMYGPHEFNGANYTSLIRTNFSNPIRQADNFNVSGYADRPVPAQPFDADNIFMLHDGACSSTCAIIHELLKSQAGVRSIAIGGRSQNGAMQSVGGTKGALTLQGINIQTMANASYTMAATDEQRVELQERNSPVVQLANATLAILRSADQASGPQINANDNTRITDVVEQTPLQFIYEAADCRLFYTAANILNVTSTWEAVANAAWRGGRCVEGSQSPATSVSGGGANSTSTDEDTAGDQPPDVYTGAAMTVEPSMMRIATVLAIAALII